MSDHSKYSASGQEAATLCPGKPVLEQGKPNTSSIYADEGTAAHALLADFLDGKTTPARALAAGATYQVGDTAWPVTENMAEAVQTALDNIAQIAGPDGMVLSETRVYYADHIGVPREEGWGTADVIAVRGDELQVHDYKHGMGVEFDAGQDTPEGPAPNHQMALYGLGALDQCDDTLGPFKTVRLVIHQPRIKDAPSEYVLTVEQLKAWGQRVARVSVERQQGAAEMRDKLSQAEWEAIYLQPGEKQCRFCKASATCPALRNAVAETMNPNHSVATPDEFAEALSSTAPADSADEPLWLAAALAKADLIEDWLKAVRAEVERRLLAGGQVPGYKLVQGKQGNRAWADEAAAEAQLKAMRLKVEEMYDLSLISPTTAEKLAPKVDKKGQPVPLKEGQAAPVIGPRQWKKLQELIARAPGKPHVAPVSDPRPALEMTPAADDFEAVKEDETALDAFA